MRDLRLIGLDLSLTALGVAWSHNANGEWAPGVRTIRSDETGHRRLQDLRVRIAEAYRSDPHLAVVEGGFVNNPGVTLVLAELAGIIKHDLWMHNIAYVLVAPKTRAKYAAGHGGAEKAEVLHAVRHRYGFVLGGPSAFRDDNQSDAWTLVSMAYHHYGQPLAPVGVKQAEALASVKWPTLRSPLLASVTTPPGAGGDGATVA